jgi:Domain of unknown function (DUF2019)
MKKTKISPEDSYVDAAILHHEKLLLGDPKGSNRQHDRLIKAIRQIRKQGDQGKDFLLGLLQHENESVKLWAACHLLTIDEKRAVETLKKIAAKASAWQLQTDAEMTISEWRAGRLDPDWYMKRQE